MLRPPALAQPVPDPALRAEADLLLQEILADPQDLDLAFRYAQVAIALGEYEGAIAALERMLLLDPNLPRVRLELGALYFRLGAYDVARVYLNEALESPDVPASVATRVRELLVAIDERTARHRFNGDVLVGARYQSNANAGPSDSQINLGGIDVVLDETFTDQSDFNAFGLFGGAYSYDLGTQAGDTLEAGGFAYGAFYAEQTQLNLGAFELDLGPRFQLGPRGAPAAASVRPYVVGGLIALDSVIYSTSFGGGLSLNLQPSERLNTEFLVGVRHDDFIQSSRQPAANQRDALVTTGRAVVRYAFTPTVAGEASLLVADNAADADFRSFTDLSATASLFVTIPMPYAAAGDGWIASFTAAVGRNDYDSPDPQLAPTIKRKDDEWRVGAGLLAGVTEDLALVTRIDYQDVSSNIELYTFDNLAVTMGLLWRF